MVFLLSSSAIDGNGTKKKEFIAEYKPKGGETFKTIRKVVAHPLHLLRSSAIGSFIGILPGAGSPIAAIVSYNEAVRWSKDKVNTERVTCAV